MKTRLFTILPFPFIICSCNSKRTCVKNLEISTLFQIEKKSNPDQKIRQEFFEPNSSSTPPVISSMIDKHEEKPS